MKLLWFVISKKKELSVQVTLVKMNVMMKVMLKLVMKVAMIVWMLGMSWMQLMMLKRILLNYLFM